MTKGYAFKLIKVKVVTIEHFLHRFYLFMTGLYDQGLLTFNGCANSKQKIF